MCYEWYEPYFKSSQRGKGLHLGRLTELRVPKNGGNSTDKDEG